MGDFLSRVEDILVATINATTYEEVPQSRVEALLLELKETIEAGGGGGGTTNYNLLTNKPQIGGIELTGNKTASDLSLATDAVFTGATGLVDGAKGLVPKPVAGDNAKVLFGDGTFKALNLGTAAAKDSTNSVTESSTNLVESGAVYSAIEAAITSAYKPGGAKAVEDLTSALLVAANEGKVYNITDTGFTTADFIEGAGKEIGVGSDVAVIPVSGGAYKFNLLPGLMDLSSVVTKSLTAGLIKNDGTIDTTEYISKSSTSGLVKNDGTIDETAYAKQSEMSVTAGTGADADKTTIQLKNGLTATVLTTHQSITGKADKVDGAVENNIVAFDANGNIKDSGYQVGEITDTQWTAIQALLA